jgi:hypothetical protein
MEQQILVENETHLDVHITEQPLVSISEPIQTEVVALSVEEDVKVIHEESAVLLVLTEGGSLYKKAVQNGYSGTELEWMTELLDSKASVQFVTTTIADSNNAYALALLALKAEVGDTYATNTHLSEVIAQRDLARALDKQVLVSKIDSDILASNQVMLETMVTRDQALSQNLNLLSTNLGSFGSRVSTVEQSITNETSARTLAMQSMSSSFNNRIDAELVTVNQTFVDATGSYATQLQNINTSFNNLLNASINTVNQAITTETQARASQIETLRVDFTSGLSAVIFAIQQVEIDIDGNTTAIDLVTGQVNNPTTGLNAAFTRANQAYALADNTAGAFSIIEGKVNHPSTGLAASFTFAQQVEINAQNYTSSAVNSLRNEITAPNAGWTASNTFIQSIKNTADRALTTTTTLQTSINSLDNWKTTTATVQLDSHTTAIGTLHSRAFIGVTNTTGGKATIAGLTINSVNYSLSFQGNVFELVNTSGVQQLYYNTSEGNWRFSGSLVAATFKTATSGFRAEMDGTSNYPFWYGTGTKNNANGIFYVDTAGNTTMKNAIVQGALFTSFSSGYRAELADDENYLFWIGQSSKTDANAVFFIKKNGDGYIKGSFFQGQLMRKRYGSGGVSASASGHITAGNPVRIDCTGYHRYQFSSPTEPGSDPGVLEWSIQRNGVTIASGTRQMSRLKRDPGGEGGVNWIAIDYVNMHISFTDTTPGSFGTNNTYTFTMEDRFVGSYSTTINTDESLTG